MTLYYQENEQSWRTVRGMMARTIRGYRALGVPVRIVTRGSLWTFANGPYWLQIKAGF